MSFSNISLAALLSTAAYALAPRQAPAEPGSCFQLAIQTEDVNLSGQFVQVQQSSMNNYTTGYTTDAAAGTIFAVDGLPPNFANLFALNAPGCPSKSIPLFPNAAAVAPIMWFDQADADAATEYTQLMCTVGVNPNDPLAARCDGIDSFAICSGMLVASRNADIGLGCTNIELGLTVVTCPEPVDESECPEEPEAPGDESSTATMEQTSTGFPTNQTSTSFPTNQTSTSGTYTSETSTSGTSTSETSISETSTSETSTQIPTSVPFGNGTSVIPTGTGVPVPTGTGIPTIPTAPGTIGNWNLLGCANSPSGFLGWVQIASTPIMSNEYCTVACTNYRYAGSNGANCYCAVELEDVSTTTYPDSCDSPCPGNFKQACGGAVPRNGTFSALSRAKRQLNLNDVLLTTYINAAYAPDVPIVIENNIIVNVDVIVYVDVCDVCAGGLTTCTTTSTIEAPACGCPTEVLPTIPLTTVTRPCESCGPNGGASTVTVTIPVDAVTTRTETLPAVPTGGNGGVSGGNGGNSSNGDVDGGNSGNGGVNGGNNGNGDVSGGNNGNGDVSGGNNGNGDVDGGNSGNGGVNGGNNGNGGVSGGNNGNGGVSGGNNGSGGVSGGNNGNGGVSGGNEGVGGNGGDAGTITGAPVTPTDLPVFTGAAGKTEAGLVGVFAAGIAALLL